MHSIELSNFTISNDKPLYVVNINANNNTIVVGAKEFLEIKEIKLTNLFELLMKEYFLDKKNINLIS